MHSQRQFKFCVFRKGMILPKREDGFFPGKGRSSPFGSNCRNGFVVRTVKTKLASIYFGKAIIFVLSSPLSTLVTHQSSPNIQLQQRMCACECIYSALAFQIISEFYFDLFPYSSYILTFQQLAKLACFFGFFLLSTVVFYLFVLLQFFTDLKSFNIAIAKFQLCNLQPLSFSFNTD